MEPQDLTLKSQIVEILAECLLFLGTLFGLLQIALGAFYLVMITAGLMFSEGLSGQTLNWKVPVLIFFAHTAPGGLAGFLIIQGRILTTKSNLATLRNFLAVYAVIAAITLYFFWHQYDYHLSWLFD